MALLALASTLALPPDSFAGTLEFNVDTSTDLELGFIKYNYDFPSSLEPFKILEALKSKPGSLDVDGGIEYLLTECRDALEFDVNVHAAAAAHASSSLRYISPGVEWHLGVETLAIAEAEYEPVLEFGDIHHLSISRAAARASIRDSVRFDGDGTWPVYGRPGDPQYILLKGTVHAEWSSEYGGGGWGIEAESKVQLDIKQGAESKVFRATYTHDVRDPTTRSRETNFFFTFNALLGPNPRDWIQDFDIGLFGETNVLDGRLSLGAVKSAYLIGIEFPDGTTPEDHGFSIEFKSGVTSPNLIHGRGTSPVPEPATITLLAVGGVGLCLSRLRRLRRHPLMKPRFRE